MKFLIDSADIEKIKLIDHYYPIDGVTTNPSILKAAGRNPYEVLKEINDFLHEEEVKHNRPQQLHVQVLSKTADEIIEEAHTIVDRLPGNTYVKIPTVPEGLRAMQKLHDEGNKRLTATAIYTPIQAYLAAKAGVEYCAPYINRIDNLSYDGLVGAKTIHDIFKQYNFKCQVLAASFHNTHQVLSLLHYGIGAVTVSPDIILKLIDSREVEWAVENFEKDFADLCGEGKNMSNI